MLLVAEVLCRFTPPVAMVIPPNRGIEITVALADGRCTTCGLFGVSFCRESVSAIFVMILHVIAD